MGVDIGIKLVLLRQRVFLRGGLAIGVRGGLAAAPIRLMGGRAESLFSLLGHGPCVPAIAPRHAPSASCAPASAQTVACACLEFCLPRPSLPLSSPPPRWPMYVPLRPSKTGFSRTNPL